MKKKHFVSHKHTHLGVLKFMMMIDINAAAAVVLSILVQFIWTKNSDNNDDKGGKDE